MAGLRLDSLFLPGAHRLVMNIVIFILREYREIANIKMVLSVILIHWSYSRVRQ